MVKPLFFVMVMLPGLASAQQFRIVEPIGLDLLQQREVARAQADVVVGLKTTEAPNGMRCGPGPWETRVVTTLERECEVRLASGLVRSIWVSFEGDGVMVALISAPGEKPGLVGEFKSRWVKVSGLETRANFGALRLLEDGHYSVGMVRGRWWKHGASIEFDGPIAHWNTTVLPDGDLQFTFTRGPLEYSILYARAPSEARTAAR